MIDVDACDPPQGRCLTRRADGKAIQIAAVVLEAALAGTEIAGQTIVNDALPRGVDFPVNSRSRDVVMLEMGEQALVGRE